MVGLPRAHGALTCEGQYSEAAAKAPFCSGLCCRQGLAVGRTTYGSW